MRGSILLKKELEEAANPEKAEILKRFFKTEKGGYGYGDLFFGITVPRQREISRKYKDIDFYEIESLIQDKMHESRFCALIILIDKYRNGEEKNKKKSVKLYLRNLNHVNNWDLVDVSAPCITGDFFLNRNRNELESLLYSDNLWKRRVAMVSTLGFIRNGDIKPVFEYSRILMNDNHHLIHKAAGWMLREAGKRDKKSLKKFLEEYVSVMPRTMLRYSIEKFSDKERKEFLNIRFSHDNINSNIKKGRLLNKRFKV